MTGDLLHHTVIPHANSACVYSSDTYLKLQKWPLHDEPAPIIIGLHGFTGSAFDFEPLTEDLGATFIAPDLLGHGDSSAPDSPQDYELAHQLELLTQLMQLTKAPPCILLGYSMGGRLALTLAHTLRATGEIQGLILIGASPGIRSDTQREARRVQDEALAARIEREGVAAFLEEWRQKPIISTQEEIPEPWRSRMRTRKQGLTPHGLAHTLRGVGTGVMPSLWDELPALELPTLLITGERDAKFEGIAKEMAALLPQARHDSIPGAGHCAHLEAIEPTRARIRAFLQDL